jgi:hypothetical protein
MIEKYTSRPCMCSNTPVQVLPKRGAICVLATRCYPPCFLYFKSFGKKQKA